MNIILSNTNNKNFKHMKKVLLIIFGLTLINSKNSAQCDVSFGTGDARFVGAWTDVETGETGLQTVTAGITELLTLTTSHDIWDEVNNDCTVTGGINDITIEQTLNTTLIDAYGGIIFTDPSVDASDKMNITQNSSGLSGTSTQGQLASSKSSTGDIRSYEIKVTFASHVYIEAQDFTIDVASVNTAGEAFESMSVIFLDGSGSPYGTATYTGYWVDGDGPGGTHPGVVGACPAMAPAVKPAASIYTTTGTGVYTISETGTMNLTDACNPVSGTSGTEDNKLIHAQMDAGLAPMNKIGGFIFRVNLENIATSTADGIDNGTRTRFTSRLDGFNLTAVSLPVELLSFQVNKDENTYSAYLSWVTASEKNNQHFIIERSSDGNTFREIGKKEGFENSLEEKNYSFIDEVPLEGKNYYRLCQVDLDGTKTYSDIKSVIFHGDKLITLYPTIVNSNLQLIVNDNNFDNLNYKILNLSGQTLLQGKINANESISHLDISSLSTGQYMIAFIYKDNMQIERFFKL